MMKTLKLISVPIIIPMIIFGLFSSSSFFPKPPVKMNDSLIPGLNTWKEVHHVITDKEVTVRGFKENHPKEPAAFYYNGYYYVAVAVWNKYGGGFAPKGSRVTDKEVVLLCSKSWKGPFTQISQVTENPGTYMHTPGIYIDQNDELYVFFSDKSGGGNDIHLKHAPVNNIPESPSDWIDEGVVLSGEEYRDPCFIRGPNGKNYLFVTDGSLVGSPVSRFESDNMENWSNKVENIYDQSNRSNEGVDFVPKGNDKGYWLITIDGAGKNLYGIAGESENLLAPKFKGKYRVSGSGVLNGKKRSWYSKWAAHFDYVYESGKMNIHQDEEHHIAFFEAGNGTEFSVGVANASLKGSRKAE